MLRQSHRKNKENAWLGPAADSGPRQLRRRSCLASFFQLFLVFFLSRPALIFRVFYRAGRKVWFKYPERDNLLATEKVLEERT